MTDLADFKVDLETARPNPFNNTQVLLGDSPRTAFTKYNDFLDVAHQVIRHVGPVAPSPTFPWMRWLDTGIDPPVERQRNAANTAWVITAGMITLPNGNVGIGTSSPGFLLDLAATSSQLLRLTSDSATIRLRGSTTNANFGQLAIDSSGTTYLDSYTGNLQLGTQSAGGMVTIRTNNTERFRVDSTGNVLVTGSGGLGYGIGSGGAVTQVTSKATGVTLNKPSGLITMHNAALASNSVVSFQLTNSAIFAGDVVVVNLRGGVAGNGLYQVWAEWTVTGSCVISLRNISAGSLSEAVSLSFVVIRGATA